MTPTTSGGAALGDAGRARRLAAHVAARSRPALLQADGTLRCLAGQRWEWDGVRFEIVHPALASYEDQALRVHDRNCVLMIAGARRADPAARRHREPFRSGAGGRARRRAQGGRSARAAPRQQELVDARVPGGGEAAARGVSRRLPQPLQPSAPGGASRATRHSAAASTAPTAMAPSRWRSAAKGGIEATPYRSVYRRYWQTQMEGDPVPDPEQF